MNDRPRIYINWSAIRPATWRDWMRVVILAALGIAALALIAVLASTLLVAAIIVGAGAAIYLFIVNLFRRPGRNLSRYQGNPDA